MYTIDLISQFCQNSDLFTAVVAFGFFILLVVFLIEVSVDMKLIYRVLLVVIPFVIIASILIQINKKQEELKTAILQEKFDENSCRFLLEKSITYTELYYILITKCKTLPKSK